jgi:hypothetical protein
MKKGKPIKSKRLCKKCKYGTHNSGCYYSVCYSCEMNGENKCKCLSVPYGKPCPYFEKSEEEAEQE